MGVNGKCIEKNPHKCGNLPEHRAKGWGGGKLPLLIGAAGKIWGRSEDSSYSSKLPKTGKK